MVVRGRSCRPPRRSPSAICPSRAAPTIGQVTRLRGTDVPPTFDGVTHPQPSPPPAALPGRPVEADDALEPTSRRLPLLLIGVLALNAIGGTTSLLLDRPRTWLSFHVVFEMTNILLNLACTVPLWRGWWRTVRDLGEARVSLAATRRTLAERQAEHDAWRRSAEQALAGLGRAIDRQFQAWQLTPTEREVAPLLLQGHGHKSIAAQTRRSERTVRQHAVAVYEKAGLGGRAELAAFFLQDLIVPNSGGGGATSP
jgi:DNA-binding CsgD family transcriptional regulator